MPTIVVKKTYARFVAGEFNDLIRANIPELADIQFRILNADVNRSALGLAYITFEIQLEEEA